MPHANRPLRVLIVDDNCDAADSMAELLRAMGHDVEVAYNAESALQHYADTGCDLAFLDIGLPDIDGFALARRLRQTAKANARFVALTGYGGEDTRRNLRDSGFDAHVVKPISNQTLETLLTETARGSVMRPRQLQ